MALIKCPECEHEISDSARKCPNCGYAMKSVTKSIKNNKGKLAFLVKTCVFVSIAIIVINILIPANVKLQNVKKENSKFRILLAFGIPTSTEGNEWRYENRAIKFHGIPALSVDYDFDDNEYHFYFDDEEMDNVENVIKKYCDRAGSLYDFKYYTYGEFDVTLLNHSLFIE